MKNYFYTNINKFSAAKIAEAFDYDLKMPKVLAESGFPEGVVASFTLDPSGEHFKADYFSSDYSCHFLIC